MAASGIVIRDGGISERVMSDVWEVTYSRRHRALRWWYEGTKESVEGMKGMVRGYQYEAIISRSCQLLMMGTWLPETC